MDERYEDAEVKRLWSLEWTYQAWRNIELAVVQAQGAEGVIPKEVAQALAGEFPTLSAGDADRIQLIEGVTRHDVVAFLDWLRGRVSGPERNWVHYGMTSSDLVDTTQGVRFYLMSSQVRELMTPMLRALDRWMVDETWVAARTHGQIAEPIQMKARAWHWNALVSHPGRDLLACSRRMQICKLSGPVGTYNINPPTVEARVAEVFRLQPVGIGASQIAPRSLFAAWANSAALFVEACAKVATDIRLMNMVGETNINLDQGQVGSSSMAHKRNPIQEEQMEGMARMARGYALMLQPLGSWLERDISSSSVERVAIPDLWHIVIHTIKTMTAILRELQLDEWVCRAGAQRPQAATSRRTWEAVAEGKPIETARENARVVLRGTKDEDLAWWMRNYPRNSNAAS